MKLCQGRGSWGLGIGSAPEGCGHRIDLMEFKEHLDSALRRRIWIWGGVVLSRGLHAMIPVGPFQLKIVCNSVVLW